ncbi:MAG: membrane protein insertase YidC [Akkermansiaceae bacterium]|nr:membrane protein insertase YidC [Armatimonadota bacterium]
MLLNRQTTLHTDKTTPRFTTARLVALLLLFVVALSGVVGCAPGTPLGAQIPVSANPEQALKDGAAKVKVADEAAKVGSKEEAKKIYTDAVTYFTVAANKYKNTATGLTATMEAARIASEKLDQKQQAYTTLKAGLKTYPVGSLGTSTLPQDAVALYEKITLELDTQNSKTYYYMVMDALMKIAGNNAVLALFMVALAVTLLTWPLRKMVLVQSNEMKRFMPEMKKIQEKYKDDMMLSNEKIQEFNKKHGINPLAGCLPALAQWPITLLMYQVIAHYQFHFTGHHFLWISEKLGMASQKWPSPITGAVAPNLAESDLILMLAYVASMYFQMRFTPQSSPDPQAIETQKQMAITMPLMFFFVMWNGQWASAFVLYWFMSNILTLGQQWIINKKLPKLEPLVLDEGGNAVNSATAPVTATGPLTPNPRLISPKNRKK